MKEELKFKFNKSPNFKAIENEIDEMEIRDVDLNRLKPKIEPSITLPPMSSFD